MMRHAIDAMRRETMPHDLPPLPRMCERGACVAPALLDDYEPSGTHILKKRRICALWLGMCTQKSFGVCAEVIGDSIAMSRLMRVLDYLTIQLDLDSR